MNGMIAWFARNDVAANLLMLLIIGLGLMSLNKIPLEVFPEFASETIQISLPFRGATPLEVESGVILPVEDAVNDLRGVKEIRSVARENVGSVLIETAKNHNPRNLLADIKNRVDGISIFPAEAKRPVIQLFNPRHEVISVVISGDMTERDLRTLSDRIRDDLIALPNISQVDVDGVRPYEISIEIAEEMLQAYDLSFPDISHAINNTSLDLSAGSIKTRGGEVLITTRSKAYSKNDFALIPIRAQADGAWLTLGDIATIKDGFEDISIKTEYNRKPMVELEVFRNGDESAIDLATTVKTYLAEVQKTLPPGVEVNYWRDRSEIIKSRLGTLTNSAIQGGLIIFILLALFLRFSVAIWVCVGIPISFMGALALMPELGVSINIISLFAFIVVLGIVVDDAIVTGENIYTHMKKTGDSTRAAIEGAQEVAVPVTFGILTTIAAFLPLFMIGGDRGKVFAQIPYIVIPVLFFSLIESKLILPAHLKHLNLNAVPRFGFRTLAKIQKMVADGFESTIQILYKPLLKITLKSRYLALSLFIGFSLFIFSLVLGGHISYVFFPRVQSEVARVYLTMPAGTSFEVTNKHIEHITKKAEALRDKYRDEVSGDSIIKNILSSAGNRSGSNSGRVVFEILSPEKRSLKITSTELAKEWRQSIGTIPGAEKITFRSEIGRGGNPIDIQLEGGEIKEVTALTEVIKSRLREFPTLYDIHDSFADGKNEIRLEIKPQAVSMGLSQSDLARQVRQAIFGLEVQRIQRGHNDVRVVLRYPEQRRQSVANMRSMYFRTKDGSSIPFNTVARISTGSSPASIQRYDGKRTVNVRADLDKKNTDVEAIKRDLKPFFENLSSQYPHINFTMEGEAREQKESMQSLIHGSLLVLFLIYALLAIPFKSYTQPFIVMFVIPFGVVGAILGHIIMGMTLSVSSLLGMLALSGVVVNDSLVLVDYVNKRRAEGITLIEAVSTAGAARFRAVWLTSLTTFGGLLPLIFEKSTQAQFLIPMGVSLGFGILFATFITLLLVPINYMVLEDIKGLIRRTNGKHSVGSN